MSMKAQPGRHQHTVECYASNESGPLAYTPCRKDGLDANLRNMKRVDFDEGLRGGLTLVCAMGQMKAQRITHEQIIKILETSRWAMFHGNYEETEDALAYTYRLAHSYGAAQEALIALRAAVTAYEDDRVLEVAKALADQALTLDAELAADVEEDSDMRGERARRSGSHTRRSE